MLLNSDLRRKLTIGFGLGLLVVGGLVLYGDIQEIAQLMQHFRWSLVPAILGLTIFNYILRGWRFHYYLGQLGLKNISWWASFRIFMGGFSLSLTPGKFGEFVRLLWLKNLVGADPAKTAPSIIVDRIVDGLAMAMLASMGAWIYPQYRLAVMLALGMMVVIVIVSQIRWLVLRVLKLGERAPLISRFAHHLYNLYKSTYELLRLKNLWIGVGIGLIAWFAQSVAFYLILIGLNVTQIPELVLLAIFALALSSILGGISSLPGGLGAAEASMTGILQAVGHLSENAAVTATLLIRFCTLWFGVIFGILTVLIWREMLFGDNGQIFDKNQVETLESTKVKLTYE